MNNNNNDDNILRVYEGQRVSNVQRCSNNTTKWTLYGTTGEAAYHDAKESIAQIAVAQPLGRTTEYDAVITTDISSSFETWHRASAGLPSSFTQNVRRRAGSRTPLFVCMIAFEDSLPGVDVDAATFQSHDKVWFVARMCSKPGITKAAADCWTVVSTPQYAMRLIKETPMQDPITGEFIPQQTDYLETVPGAQLEKAFRQIVLQGRLQKSKTTSEIEPPLPKTIFLDAQRWGSALPAARHLTTTSKTQQVLSNVVYDFCSKTTFAPTTNQQQPPPDNNDTTTTKEEEEEVLNFVADTEQMLFQAGDMVSTYTPGFEGAALSGIDVAEYIFHNHVLPSSLSS